MDEDDNGKFWFERVRHTLMYVELTGTHDPWPGCTIKVQRAFLHSYTISHWARTTQQTQCAEPMLGWCWPNVCDAGPTSDQHWANASWFLGYWPNVDLRFEHCLTREWNFKNTLTYTCPPLIQSRTYRRTHKRSLAIWHFVKKWRLYISSKFFHPKSSVIRHAGSTYWNGNRTMIMSLIRICSASEIWTPRI